MQAALQIKLHENPIDTVEDIFSRKSLAFERRGDGEIVVELEGKWDNMLLFFAWEEHLHCLHISCLMNINADIVNRGRIFELLALVNENLWLGHFSYWSEHQMPLFKHSVIIHDGETDFESKIDQVINIAVNECERMYPVFNAVLTQNISPEQALFPAKTFLQ